MRKTPSKSIRDPLGPVDEKMRSLKESLMAAASAPAPQTPDPADRRGVMVRLPPEMAKSFRILAAELDTTQQALLSEAVNELLSKYNK